jgi:hypothetical protein
MNSCFKILYPDYIAITVYARTNSYRKNKGFIHWKKSLVNFVANNFLRLHHAKTWFFFQFGLIFITCAYMGLQHARITMKQYNGERVMAVKFFFA